MFDIHITVYDAENQLMVIATGVVERIPETSELEMLAAIVMADGKRAVATVHPQNDIEIVVAGAVFEVYDAS
jgi:hypothetical protein